MERIGNTFFDLTCKISLEIKSLKSLNDQSSKLVWLLIYFLSFLITLSLNFHPLLIESQWAWGCVRSDAMGVFTCPPGGEPAPCSPARNLALSLQQPKGSLQACSVVNSVPQKGIQEKPLQNWFGQFLKQIEEGSQNLLKYLPPGADVWSLVQTSQGWELCPFRCVGHAQHRGA